MLIDSGCKDPAALQEGRFHQLRRQLRRATMEKDAALLELQSYERKDRGFALSQRQLQGAVARVQDLEKRAASQEKYLHKEQVQMMTAQGRAAQAEAHAKTYAIFNALTVLPRPGIS